MVGSIVSGGGTRQLREKWQGVQGQYIIVTVYDVLWEDKYQGSLWRLDMEQKTQTNKCMWVVLDGAWNCDDSI